LRPEQEPLPGEMHPADERRGRPGGKDRFIVSIALRLITMRRRSYAL